MKRFFAVLAMASCWFAAPSFVNASVLSNLLTSDGPAHYALNNGAPYQGGGEDKLQDDSVSKFEDVDGSGGYSKGDVIWGVLTLSQVQSSGRGVVNVGSFPPGQVAVVFSAKIAGFATNSTGATVFNLAPIADSTSNYDLRKILPLSVQNGLSNESIITILSSTTDENVLSGAENPLNWFTYQVNNSLVDPSTTVAGSSKFTNANNWFWELTADMKAANNDFFQFVPDAALEGRDKGGLTITSNAFGATWIPVDVIDYLGVMHKNDLTLNLGVVSNAGDYYLGHGWTLTDKSDLYVNAVPEPAAMAVWVVLCGCGGLGLFRRRRRS